MSARRRAARDQPKPLGRRPCCLAPIPWPDRGQAGAHAPHATGCAVLAQRARAARSAAWSAELAALRRD